MKSALCSVARLTVVPPMKTGVKLGYRRELAGAAHLHGDAVDLRHARFGGEFIGDGPARRAAGIAQALLGRVRVHFEHHAVDLVAERGAAQPRPRR